jgi:hypothetical protein
MTTSINKDDDKIKENLEFILSHLQQPIFPRKIMTKDLGYQLEVFDKQEALSYFKSSRYEDCRINAYPPFTEYQGINRTPISFLMIDLDLKDFVRAGDSKNKEIKLLERALNKTLENIKESINGNPTVLWTGNGYHIYQPVGGEFILEEYETFYEFTKYFDKDLTSLFIQFAEEYFTDNTADRLHYPTVKSCLLRVPGSLNSKYIVKDGDGEKLDPEVKIIQKWDCNRSSIQPLLGHFRTWLIQKRFDDVEKLKKQEEKKNRFQIIVAASQNQKDSNEAQVNKIKWIDERILENPLSDHRKYIIWRILSPYLLNVKKLPKEESYSVIKDWLDKCNKLEKLNFNAKVKIKEGIKSAQKGYFPISLEKLKEENKALYDIVVNRP